jgi:hypothetical protein
MENPFALMTGLCKPRKLSLTIPVVINESNRDQSLSNHAALHRWLGASDAALRQPNIKGTFCEN